MFHKRKLVKPSSLNTNVYTHKDREGQEEGTCAQDKGGLAQVLSVNRMA